jgi:hypothetical protein
MASRRLPARALAILITAATFAAITTADAGAVGPVAGGPAGQDVCSAQAAAATASPTVANLKAFGDCEIARRQTTLASLAGVVKAAPALTTPDRAALNADISTAKATLATLKTQLDSAVTAVACKATIAQVVAKVRVYVLVVPQVRLTVAADDVLSLKPHLQALAAALSQRIADAAAAGKDTAAAQSSLDAMNAALAKAESLAAPWPSQLVSLTPAQYDAGTAGPILQQARSALANASQQLKAALVDGRAILAALR